MAKTAPEVLAEEQAKNPWKSFRRKGTVEARPYVSADADYGGTVSISPADARLPSLIGGMIARNPDNANDQWYINAEYFRKHYEEV